MVELETNELKVESLHRNLSDCKYWQSLGRCYDGPVNEEVECTEDSVACSRYKSFEGEI